MYFYSLIMQKSIKSFFVFSLLLLFLYNVSGYNLSVEHAGHTKNFSVKVKDSKTENQSSISQDDDCQCALHMQMNHMLLIQPVTIELANSTSTIQEIPHTKAIAYHCLLDYFSSRAPPYLS